MQFFSYYKLCWSPLALIFTSSIYRSINAVPSPPTGVESPPSPTGSPELNISSPPRLQSLDSRLADLFSEEGNQEANRQTADESDSESDTDLISRANRVLGTKEEDVLPGLGDLDQIKASSDIIQGSITQSGSVISVESTGELRANESDLNAAMSNANVTISSRSEISTSLLSLFSTSNQSIPVIGGLSRPIPPMVDGSSTPTLDEEPYEPPSSKPFLPVSVDPPVAPTPTYNSDALSFLSKLMATSKTSDINKTDSNSVPTPPTNATLQPHVSTNTAYGTYATPPPVWPPANPPVIASTVSSQIWSSPPPLPSLPPPPVFSWPPNPDPTLPPPWSSIASSSSNLAQTDSDSRSLSSPVSTSTNAYSSSVEPAALRHNHEPSPHSRLPLPNEPPIKKGKWDVKDTDYRCVS